jgi:hypothetical protein
MNNDSDLQIIIDERQLGEDKSKWSDYDWMFQASLFWKEVDEEYELQQLIIKANYEYFDAIKRG